MRKLLSIFMSVVMVVTMLPKMSFAEVGKTESTANEEQQAGGTEDKKDNVNTGFLKEKAPKVWELLKPYVEQVENWGKNYYSNVSEFAGKVGPLGVAATMGLSTLAVKVVWKTLKFVVALFGDDDSGQTGSCAPSSSYSANCGQTAICAYPTIGYQPSYSYN